MRLSITEIEINRILSAAQPRDLPLANLNAQVTPAGIAVTGEYCLMFTMPFRTEWALNAVRGGLEAHLTDLQVAGFPAGKFRGLLLKLIRDAVKDPKLVQVEGERVWVDVAGAVPPAKAPVRADVTVVACQAGSLEVEVVIGPA